MVRFPLFVGILAVGCLTACEQPARVAIPTEAISTEKGMLFPRQLSEIAKGCDYPAIKDPPVLSRMEREYLSDALSSAQEPPLVEIVGENSETSAFRFIWLRSFHAPVIVRVVSGSDGRAQLTAKLMTGLGGYDLGKVDAVVDRPLSTAEVGRFRAVMDKARIAGVQSSTCDLGCDGATWLVEAIDDGIYRYLERWSPEDGPIRDLGLHMLGLTGWTFDEIY